MVYHLATAGFFPHLQSPLPVSLWPLTVLLAEGHRVPSVSWPSPTPALSQVWPQSPACWRRVLSCRPAAPLKTSPPAPHRTLFWHLRPLSGNCCLFLCLRATTHTFRHASSRIMYWLLTVDLSSSPPQFMDRGHISSFYWYLTHVLEHNKLLINILNLLLYISPKSIKSHELGKTDIILILKMSKLCLRRFCRPLKPTRINFNPLGKHEVVSE